VILQSLGSRHSVFVSRGVTCCDVDVPGFAQVRVRFAGLWISWRGGGWADRRRAGRHPIIQGQDIRYDRDQHQHHRDDEAPVLMEFFPGVFGLVVVAHKSEDWPFRMQLE